MCSSGTLGVNLLVARNRLGPEAKSLKKVLVPLQESEERQACTIVLSHPMLSSVMIGPAESPLSVWCLDIGFETFRHVSQIYLPLFKVYLSSTVLLQLYKTLRQMEWRILNVSDQQVQNPKDSATYQALSYCLAPVLECWHREKCGDQTGHSTSEVWSFHAQCFLQFT